MKLASSKPNALSLAIAGAITLTLCGTNGAYAQRQIEEVVITAERREATEQTTSISMEVFTSDDLSSNQVRELSDLQNAMPGIQVADNGLSNNINIRGIGNTQTSPDVQMGVQIINDGFTQGEPMGLNGAFFDVGTVEVLRGPQGTFVGQSAAGGAILINSARPNFDGINGFVEGTVGNYHRNQVQGAINLPISDTLAGRIAVNTERRGSFYRNLGTEFGVGSQGFSHPGSVDDRQVRLSLLWQPNQQFEAIGKIEVNNVNHNGQILKPKFLPTTGSVLTDHDSDPLTDPIPVEVTTYSQYLNYSPTDPYTVYQDQMGQDEQTNEQYTLQMSYELQNGMMINTRSGYNRLSVHSVSDSDESGAPLSPGLFELGPDNRSWSQEVTLASPEAPTNWIVGAYTSQRTTSFRLWNPIGESNEGCGWQNDGTHDDCGPMELPDSYSHVQPTSEVSHRAFFGQYNYALTEELELAVGARYNMDSSSRLSHYYTIEPASASAQPAGSCPQFGSFAPRLLEPWQVGAGQQDPYACYQSRPSVLSDIETKPVDTDIPTWKVGLNWSPTDDDYFYVFYARGYKAATHQGVNGVKPEQVDDYELGWKGSLLDGALSGDLGFYYMDYADLQGTYFQNTNPLGADSINGNIGDATMMGLESSFRWFIENFSINGSVAFQDSEIDNVQTLNTALLPNWTDLFNNTETDYLPQCGLNPATDIEATAAVGGVPNGTCFNYNPYYQNLTGQQQVTSPELAYNLAVDYQFAWAGGTLTPRLSYSHTDESYADLIQTPYYLNEERNLLDFSATYENDMWTVQAFITNLTEEVYIANAQGSLMSYGSPRQYGVRARMNF